MFTRLGTIEIEAEDVDEEKLMEDALEAGASDFINDEDVFIIRTEPNDLGLVRDDLDAKGYKFVSAEIEYVPSNYTKLTDEEDLKMMGRLLEMMEDNDDVQGVWHNLENVEDLP
jgi:transcriptional/translational regulatory protein YebC/TACO1